MAYEFKIPKVLKGFNLFIKDKGFAGRVDEITLPKLSIKSEELKAGGMDIPVSMDMGMEKLECSMKLLEYTPEVIKLFGINERSPVDVVLKGALDDEETRTKVEIELRGSWSEVDMGSWKAGDKQTLSLSMGVRYYKLNIAGEDLVEIDAMNMERVIGGVDQLASLKDLIS